MEGSEIVLTLSWKYSTKLFDRWSLVSVIQRRVSLSRQWHVLEDAEDRAISRWTEEWSDQETGLILDETVDVRGGGDKEMI